VTGWSFTGWAGTRRNRQPVNVTMNGPQAVTASFAINTYSLRITVISSRTVAKNPDQSQYDHGTNVSYGWRPLELPRVGAAITPDS
jgi:hypothetical protein